MNQRDRDLAIQQAIASNPNPGTVAALMQYQRTGIPPTDPAALTAFMNAAQAMGLTADPAVVAAAQSVQAQTGGDNTDPYAPANAAQNQRAEEPGMPATGAGGTQTGGPSNVASGTRPAGPSQPNDPSNPNRVPGSAAPPTATTLPTPAVASKPVTAAPGGLNAANATMAAQGDFGMMREILRSIGLDPDNLGLSGSAIANQLKPFAQAFTKLDGMDKPNGGTPGDNVMNRIAEFGNMFNGDKGFYGQLQSFGQGLAGGAAGRMGDITSDVGIQKSYLDMINMLSNAGGNALNVQGAKEAGDRAIGAFSDAEMNAAKNGTPRPNNYVKWLQSQQGQPNQFNDIIRLVTGGR